MSNDRRKVISLESGRLEDAHSFIDELISDGHTAIVVLGVAEGAPGDEDTRQYSFADFGSAWAADRVFAAKRYIWRLMGVWDARDA